MAERDQFVTSALGLEITPFPAAQIPLFGRSSNAIQQLLGGVQTTAFQFHAGQMNIRNLEVQFSKLMLSRFTPGNLFSALGALFGPPPLPQYPSQSKAKDTRESQDKSGERGFASHPFDNMRGHARRARQNRLLP